MILHIAIAVLCVFVILGLTCGGIGEAMMLHEDPHERAIRAWKKRDAEEAERDRQLKLKWWGRPG